MGLPSPSSFEPRRTHKTTSSSDFGDFHSAPVGASPRNAGDNAHHHQQDLHSGDLLMSFDDIDEDVSRPASAAPRVQQRNIDLLSDELDFGVPPKRSAESSPTRMRHGSLRGRRSFSTFTGPSSPPRVSEAGADIIFHPPYRAGPDNTAAKSLRRMSHGPGMDFDRAPSEDQRRDTLLGDDHRDHSHGPSHTEAESSHHASPRPRSLVDAFATSKLATRWKRSVLGPNLIHQLAGEPEPPSKTAVPIDISHTSPFASRDQIAGSYVAPDGAPGFRSADSRGHWNDEGSWANVRLEGRRESTTPVLSQAQAQAVSLGIHSTTDF